MASEHNQRGRSSWHLRLAGLALAFLLLPIFSRAQTVITDCSPGGLAAALAAGGNFTLECDGVITLSQTLQVTRNTTLDASNHRLMLSGLTQAGLTNVIRLFLVNPGVRLTLINLQLANGHGTNGAAIYNNGGFVTLQDCILSNNIASGRNGGNGANGKSSSSGQAGSGRGGGAGGAAFGGAIYNKHAGTNLGTIILSHCLFTTNVASGGNGGPGGNGGNGHALGGNGGAGGAGGTAYGGAIYNAGRLLITNSTFFYNEATGGNAARGGTNGTTSGFPGYPGHGSYGGGGSGGAIYNVSKSTAIIVGSTFADNLALSGNSADAGRREGQGANGPRGPDSRGGALCNFSTAVLLNSTFFENFAIGGLGGNGGAGSVRGGTGGDGGSGWGGQIYNGSITGATNCTFHFGAASGAASGAAGPGIFAGKAGRRGVSRGSNLANGSGRFHLKNTLIAFPYVQTNGSFVGTNGYGAFTDVGYNLSSDRSMRLKGVGSMTNTDPRIGVLGRNGGATETIPLLRDSPAIDAGDPRISISNSPALDQRGSLRPFGLRADIGAYEFGRFYVPPIILTEPMPVTAQVGATVQFAVTVESDAPVFYQWRFGANTTPIAGAIAATLTLTNISTTNAGEYSVVAANNFGSTTSIPATLTVITPATVISMTPTINPLVVRQGSNVVFRVSAIGDGALEYFWLFNRTNFFVGATLSTVTLPDVQTNDTGLIQAVVRNSFSYATSAPVQLIVSNARPTIIRQPMGQTVAPGDPVTFTVEIAAGSLPVRYSWFFNDALLTNLNSISFTNTGIISDASVQTNQAGRYYVVITNISGVVTSTPFMLTITTSPPIIVTAPTNLTVNVGESATFSVVADGSRPLTYFWYFDGINLLQSGTNAALTLNNTTPAHIGAYTVVVSNRFGTETTAAAMLDVKVAPVTITNQPESQSIFTGESVIFSVTAEGSQPFTYRWFKGAVAIPGAVASTYSITAAGPEHAGNYTVEVGNYAGPVLSDPALLTVTEAAPLIDQQPESIAVTNGGTASFTAVVSGSRPLFFQWQKDDEDIPGATNRILTITNLEFADAADYTLTITNEFGEALTEIATLTVLAADVLVMRDENRALIIWATEVGIEYTVEYRDPGLAEWTEIASAELPIEGNGNDQSIEDPEPGAQNLTDREYRVVGTPVP